jgi:uncharacterized protein involved in type VI secretion and phage assembly
MRSLQQTQLGIIEGLDNGSEKVLIANVFKIDNYTLDGSDSKKSIFVKKTDFELHVYPKYLPDCNHEDKTESLKFESQDSSINYSPETLTQRPEISSLQQGIVVKRNETVYGDWWRVKVKPLNKYCYPKKEGSKWDDWYYAKTGQEHASAGFGSFGLPRENEELSLSFLSGNPEHPMLLK